jgi:hypothetical protein
MAVGGAVAVVLSLVIVVATRPSDDERAASPGPEGLYSEVIAPGATGGDEVVTLHGGYGARAEIGIRRVSDHYSQFTALPGQRTVMFAFHIRNAGRGWFSTALDASSVRATDGRAYQADRSLSSTLEPGGSTGREEIPDQPLGPGLETNQYLDFTLPLDAQPVQLHLVLFLGETMASADVNP